MAAVLREKIDVSLAARQYVANGWALVPIPSGKKFPTAKGWNRLENCVRTPAACNRVKDNVGIAHAYSGTCTLDLDDMIKSAAWLASHGIDLAELWNDPLAVRISSGRPNRGKLLFKRPPGVSTLRTHPLHDEGLELRCASTSGATVQDVLPPSIHPKTGEPYAWEYAEPLLGDWRNPPDLPAAVLALWQSLSAQEGFSSSDAGRNDTEAALATLAKLSPDMGYHDWIKVGMALHHEFAGSYEGFELWDEWSAPGAEYKNSDDLEFHWRSFNADKEGSKSTLDGLQAELRRAPISPDTFDMLMDEAEITEPLAASTSGDEPVADHKTVIDDFEALDAAPAQDGESPPAKKKLGFVFQSVDEFLNREPPSWIIKGLLPRAELGVIYGDSGAGKTFVALDQAMAIARGVEWRGRKTKQGRVAYIVAEGQGGFQDRIQAYCMQNDIDRASLPLSLLAAAPDFMDSDKESKVGIVALGRALKALGPLSAIYVDTYARVMSGNENEAKDAGAVVANCALLHRVTGAIIILVHHSGKDSAKGARGSGVLRAAADVEYAVTKATGRHTIQITKMKDGEDMAQYHFRLLSVAIGMDEEDEIRTSCVVEHTIEGPTASEQAEEKARASGVEARILEQMATYIGGEVTPENLVLDVRAITPLPPSGVESKNWKALITRPLKKLIEKGEIVEAGSVLRLPNSARD